LSTGRGSPSWLSVCLYSAIAPCRMYHFAVVIVHMIPCYVGVNVNAWPVANGLGVMYRSGY